VKIRFIYGGKLYKIYRSCQREANGSVTYDDRDFYQIEADGELCLNAKNKKDTQKVINEYLGNFRDFVMCNLLVNDLHYNMIKMTDGERLKALKSLFNLNIYDQYLELNKKECATLKLRSLELKNKYQHLRDASSSIEKMCHGGQLEQVKQLLLTKRGESSRIQAQLMQSEKERTRLLVQLSDLEKSFRPIKIIEVNQEQDELFQLQKEYSDLDLDFKEDLSKLEKDIIHLEHSMRDLPSQIPSQEISELSVRISELREKLRLNDTPKLKQEKLEKRIIELRIKLGYHQKAILKMRKTLSGMPSFQGEYILKSVQDYDEHLEFLRSQIGQKRPESKLRSVSDSDLDHIDQEIHITSVHPII